MIAPATQAPERTRAVGTVALGRRSAAGYGRGFAPIELLRRGRLVDALL